MHGCKHTTGFIGMLLLVLGIVFLIADLSTWNFWGIQWWSVMFIVLGLGHMMMGSCKACESVKKK